MIETGLDTERLTLRVPRSGDARTLVDLVTSNVSRWTTWPYPLTEDEARSRIIEIRNKAQRREQLPFIIDLKGNGTSIGWIRVRRRPDAPETAVLGYWLGDDFHGSGFMGEAVDAVISHAPLLMQISLMEEVVRFVCTASRVR